MIPGNTTNDSDALQLMQRGKTLARAGQIRTAVEILERALTCAARARNVRVCADALDWLSWLAWIDLDGTRAHIYARRMLRLELPPTSPQAFRLSLRQATQTLQLGDAHGALAIIEAAEHAGRDADIDAFMAYLSVKADVHAALGDTRRAVGHAQLAAEIAQKRSDGYAHWRRREYLGYIEYAAGNLSESLQTYLLAEQIARDLALTWEVAFSRVRAAWIALLLGDLPRAHELIAGCFTDGDGVRWMLVTRAWVGLTIGLIVEDTEVIARCGDADLLTIALDSGDAYTLGRTAAAFIEYDVQRGEMAAAAALLERAVRRITSPDCALALFEPIALYGDAALVARGQALLDAFPASHRLAHAQRPLFAAIVARRAGDVAAAEQLASQAQLAFEDCEHHYAAAQCMELAGRRAQAHARYLAMGAVRDARRTADAAPRRRGRPRTSDTLSFQRRDVLELLLAGATTQMIADRLGCSARTVKHRVAEIFVLENVSSRVELRARYLRR